jgi:hypothetical protein
MRRLGRVAAPRNPDRVNSDTIKRKTETMTDTTDTTDTTDLAALEAHAALAAACDVQGACERRIRAARRTGSVAADAALSTVCAPVLTLEADASAAAESAFDAESVAIALAAIMSAS